MRSKINRLGTELFVVGLGQAVAAVGSVVAVRLMTGVLTSEMYGEVSLANTFVGLIQQILVGPFSASLTRYFNVAQEKEELPGFFSTSYSMSLKISLATIALFGLGAGYLWITGQSAYLEIAVFTLVFALLSGYNILLDSLQTAARQRAIVAWHQGIGQWLRYFTAIGLVLLIGRSPAIVMAGYALSALLILGSQTYFFKRKMPAGTLQKGSPDPAWTTRILQYSTPFAAWGIFTWMQISSDRWAIQTFSTTQEVGFYTVLYQLGYYPLTMLTSVFVQFASPVLFRQAGDGTQADRIKHAQRNTWLLLVGAVILTVVATILVSLLHPFIFELLVAPEYRSVSGLLPIMVLSGGMFACGQIASLSQLNRGDAKALLRPKIAMGVVGTLFNIAGAYWMGLSGVVYAGAAFSGLYLLWILLLQRSAGK
jgi:O-antigen/teichoic acid export membrane protein